MTSLAVWPLVWSVNKDEALYPIFVIWDRIAGWERTPSAFLFTSLYFNILSRFWTNKYSFYLSGAVL